MVSTGTSESLVRRRPCILIFDSLTVHHRSAKTCAKTVLAYLAEEYKLKRGEGTPHFDMDNLASKWWGFVNFSLTTNQTDSGEWTDIQSLCKSHLIVGVEHFA